MHFGHARPAVFGESYSNYAEWRIYNRARPNPSSSDYASFLWPISPTRPNVSRLNFVSAELTLVDSAGFTFADSADRELWSENVSSLRGLGILVVPAVPTKRETRAK